MVLPQIWGCKGEDAFGHQSKAYDIICLDGLLFPQLQDDLIRKIIESGHLDY